LSLAFDNVCRDLAVAFMLFTMRLELARARANEGLRVDEEAGPDIGEAFRAKTALYPPDRDFEARVMAAGEHLQAPFHLCAFTKTWANFVPPALSLCSPPTPAFFFLFLAN
jgi:hypothetical protein